MDDGLAIAMSEIDRRVHTIVELEREEALSDDLDDTVGIGHMRRELERSLGCYVVNAMRKGV